jgi:hypothetical protein
MKTVQTVNVASGLSQDERISFPPPMIDIIQIDPEDTLDLLREAIDKQRGPVIFLVPQWSQVFAQGSDFARLSKTAPVPQRINFVIPPSRFEVLSTLASQQGFGAFPSLEAALSQLVQGHVPASSTALVTSPPDNARVYTVARPQAAGSNCAPTAAAARGDGGTPRYYASVNWPSHCRQFCFSKQRPAGSYQPERAE